MRKRGTKKSYVLKRPLNEKAQKKLDLYLRQLTELRDSLVADTYGSNAPMYRQDAERLKMRIARDFSYNKVKNSLK